MENYELIMFGGIFGAAIVFVCALIGVFFSAEIFLRNLITNRSLSDAEKSVKSMQFLKYMLINGVGIITYVAINGVINAAINIESHTKLYTWLVFISLAAFVIETAVTNLRVCGLIKQSTQSTDESSANSSV